MSIQKKYAAAAGRGAAAILLSACSTGAPLRADSR
jgi:hypothetical protein